MSTTVQERIVPRYKCKSGQYDNRRFLLTDGEVIDGKFFSRLYIQDHIVTCMGTGLRVRKEDAIEYVSPRIPQISGWYAKSTVETLFKRCFVTDKLYHTRDLLKDSTGKYMLSALAQGEYAICRSTGVFVRRKDAVFYEGSWYLRDKGPSTVDDGEPDGISSYDYKPEPRFHGGEPRNLMLGVELEVGDGGNDTYNARKVLNIGNEHSTKLGLIYVKSDTSVRRGFEIVSHPATLEYHTNHIPWKRMADKCLEMGYNSHKNSTCGLHVHISKEFFGERETEQDVGIMKLIYLVEVFWDKVLKFSRRTTQQVETWANRYGLSYGETPEELLEKAKDEEARYRAVNLTSEYTVEIRLFRGTLRYETFLATLQLCNVLAKVSKYSTVEEVRLMTWESLIKEGEHHGELMNYLTNRGINPLR